MRNISAQEQKSTKDRKGQKNFKGREKEKGSTPKVDDLNRRGQHLEKKTFTGSRGVNRNRDIHLKEVGRWEKRGEE